MLLVSLDSQSFPGFYLCFIPASCSCFKLCLTPRHFLAIPSSFLVCIHSLSHLLQLLASLKTNKKAFYVLMHAQLKRVDVVIPVKLAVLTAATTMKTRFYGSWEELKNQDEREREVSLHRLLQFTIRARSQLHISNSSVHRFPPPRFFFSLLLITGCTAILGNLVCQANMFPLPQRNIFNRQHVSVPFWELLSFIRNL